MSRLEDRRQAAVIVAIFAIIVVLLAAIVASFAFPEQPPTQPATLSVTGSIDANNETTIFRGQAEMRGRTEGSTFEGVEVHFHDENATQFKTVAIGTLRATSDDTEAWKSSFNTTLTKPPARVTVSYSSFSNARDRPVETIGLRLQNGRLVPYTATPS